jgi:16S rRNA (adenine1518-N6/adenine1519-N6)-dimethyltransferase
MSDDNQASDASAVRALLARYNLQPKKSLGQNFLVDQAALIQVVTVADISPGDVVLEVGPGLGGLTRLLAAQAQKVIAVELDGRFRQPLAEILAPHPNVHLVTGDILKLDPALLVAADSYLVVANIPYYITSALIRHLLEAEIRPRRLVLTVQREVAQRICAEPGQLSMLALSVQVYGEPKARARLAARSFYPAPKVDSSVVRVDIYDDPLIPRRWLAPFFRLARAGFSQKRKNLRNALAGGLSWPKDAVVGLLEQAGIDPTRRAQTLSISEWRTLTKIYMAQDGSPS